MCNRKCVYKKRQQRDRVDSFIGYIIAFITIILLCAVLVVEAKADDKSITPSSNIQQPIHCGDIADRYERRTCVAIQQNNAYIQRLHEQKMEVLKHQNYLDSLQAVQPVYNVNVSNSFSASTENTVRNINRNISQNNNTNSLTDKK